MLGVPHPKKANQFPIFFPAHTKTHSGNLWKGCENPCFQNNKDFVQPQDLGVFS